MRLPSGRAWTLFTAFPSIGWLTLVVFLIIIVVRTIRFYTLCAASVLRR